MSEAVDNPAEEWKAISDCPNYSVSNIGRVRKNIKGSSRERCMRQFPNKHGYLTLDLYHDGNKRFKSVSRLVALAFLDPDPDPERNEVNHKNGIKSDNRVQNLEWCSRTENVQHSYDTGLRHGLAGEKSGNAKLTDNQVYEIRKMASQGFPSAQIAHLFNVTPQNVSHIRNGKAWKHLL